MDRTTTSLPGALLLKTKLYVPAPHQNLVPRPRLIEHLNQGIEHKLTLVSAPAGFGKTTLLSEWVNGDLHGHQVAWLSLDEDDNDPARFLSYMIAALRMMEENIGASILGTLYSPQPPPIAELLTHLVNEISAIPDNLILVLDDYHLIAAQPVHDILIFLLDHLPRNLHLAIATRVDPPLPIARLRGRGQMTELRQVDLRFTADEAARFLNQVMGLELGPADIASLASRTEGWIAGLQMAAVSMHGRQDLAAFIAAFTGSEHHILDYLMEEVLQRQSEHVQSFLLQTSILARMSSALCDAVTGGSNSHAMLESLEHANLFVVPLDDNQQWYRYHHLFSDLLQHRLQEVQPDLITTLHGRASVWFEQNGQTAEAIDHALAAQDWERAARLVSAQAELLWARGQHIALSRWLEALPDALVSSYPELTLHHAMTLFMAGKLEETEQHLQMAELALAPGAEPGIDRRSTRLEGTMAMIRAYLALFRGDAPGIARFSQRALDLLPEEVSMWRSGALMAAGDACSWTGELITASRNYEQALVMGEALGNIYFTLMAAAKLALNEAHQGKLERAAQICREGLELAQMSGFIQTARAGTLMATLAWILCERNDLDSAFEYARQGVEMCERERNMLMLGFSYLVWLVVAVERNELPRAHETWRQLEHLARESNIPIWVMTSAAAWEAKAWLKQNDLQAAAGIFRGRGLTADGQLSVTHYSEYLTLARLFVAQGEFPTARRLLGRLLQTAEANGRTWWAIETQVVQAVALHALGNTSEALTALEHALFLGEPNNYVRTFVGGGKPIYRLLYDYGQELIQRAGREDQARHRLAYVEKLLAAFAEPETGPLPQPRSEASPERLHPKSEILIEPLSERELELLRLLTTELSSLEIAEQLCVSVNTVRSHIKNIYAKLNAHSRYEAVARAKELALI